jgi:hypothetical protein
MLAGPPKRTAEVPAAVEAVAAGRNPYRHERDCLSAPRATVKKIKEPGPLDETFVRRIGDRLHEAFPARYGFRVPNPKICGYRREFSGHSWRFAVVIVDPLSG